MKTPTEDLEMFGVPSDLVEKGHAFVDDMRAAYNKAAEGGLDPEDLAGLILCYAYATMQLTFELDRPGLAGMVVNTIRKYLDSGAFERNRDFADHVGPMQ